MTEAEAIRDLAESLADSDLCFSEDAEDLARLVWSLGWRPAAHSDRADT